MFIKNKIKELHELGFNKKDICKHVLNYYHWQSLNNNERKKLINKILGEIA